MRTNLELSTELRSELALRSAPATNGKGHDLSTSASAALASYFHLLAMARVTMVGLFSNEELLLIMECLKGNPLNFWTGRSLPTLVSDKVTLYELDKHYGVDAGKLVNKLGNLSIVQCAALVDAATRYWLTAPEKRVTEDILSVLVESPQTSES